MLTKQQILDEIKRTAKETGGKPLGTASFERETGIGYYDWGRYWPKFSDAQQEAGFIPNQPYTAHPNEFLIEKMIIKIRKFGKYPTLGELRVETNNDPDFPYVAIKKRKQEFIAKKVVEYCKAKNGYDDIIQLCKPILEKFDKHHVVDAGNANKESGEVYLFKSGKYYKIGKTNDTVRRGNEIRIQLPEKMDLIHSIKTDDPSGIEAYWHRRFETKRMKGEWFDLNSTDIKAFKRWKRIV